MSPKIFQSAQEHIELCVTFDTIARSSQLISGFPVLSNHYPVLEIGTPLFALLFLEFLLPLPCFSKRDAYAQTPFRAIAAPMVLPIACTYQLAAAVFNIS